VPVHARGTGTVLILLSVQLLGMGEKMCFGVSNVFLIHTFQIDKGLYPKAFCKIIPDLLAGDPGQLLFPSPARSLLSKV